MFSWNLRASCTCATCLFALHVVGFNCEETEATHMCMSKYVKVYFLRSEALVVLRSLVYATLLLFDLTR
jgi:hypothetical protein